MTHSVDRDDRDSTLIGVASLLFLMGIVALLILRFGGCGNVRIEEYRYCKRIGYEAYAAQRDTAYWAQYGMKP